MIITVKGNFTFDFANLKFVHAVSTSDN